MTEPDPASDSALLPRRVRATPHASGAALLILLGLLLIGAIVLVWRTVTAETLERQQFAQSDAVLTTLHDLQEITTDAETGQRGYFITLDPRYLEPYRAAQTNYPVTLERLRIMLAGDSNPRKQALLRSIVELTQAKFAELDETVLQVAGGNRMIAGQTFLSDRGKNAMDQLRQALHELEAIERAENNASITAASKLEANLIPALVLLTVMIIATLAIGLWQVRRIAESEARAATADALADANERVNLLAGELNHRVKNLFSMVLAIVRMTGRDDQAASPTIERIAARIEALDKAHDVSSGARGEAGNLRDLIDTALSPYRSNELASTIDGPPYRLTADKVVPLGLLLHELATNAVKYGAWAVRGGTIAVTWSLREDLLTLTWEETCSVPCPQPEAVRKGFGSLLAESTARQLGGQIERTFAERGVFVTLTFPS